MDEEGPMLPPDESLRMAAIDFTLRFQKSLTPRDVIATADLVYKFLKTGQVPEKDHDDASELQ